MSCAHLEAVEAGAGGLLPCIQDNAKNGLSRNKEFDEYHESFAKKFPALIHTCGLAQAVAFALAKKETGYVEDLGSSAEGGSRTSRN